jgi:UPF0755 protein
LRTFFLFLVLAIVGVGGWLAWALWAPVTPEGQKFVMLRQGYSTRRIARELKSAGVIRNAESFVLWHYLHRKCSLKAGEYLFDKSANALEVHDRLARGDIYVHTVVIPEGYTIFDIAQAIQDAGLGSSQEFLNVAMSDNALIADLAPQAKTLEGYLFPNTYEFTRTQDMQEMAAAMVKQFRQVAHEIGLPFDLQKTVTMASIVEKETAVPDERPLVASVYYNRLAKNIPLQFHSAYNTYLHPGLPPGPIGNPGKSSLEAALHPATTDYYYFVSDGNGHHKFAHSLEEHNRNVGVLRHVMQRK